MGGIMMPIITSEGIQRAHRDNQADQQFKMGQESHGKAMQGLDLGLRRDTLALDEYEKELPLKQMKRDADLIAARAKQALMAIDGQSIRMGDAEYDLKQDQVGPFLAKTLTEMPAFGAVEFKDGKLVSGQKVFTVDEMVERLVGLADPENAFKVKQLEYTPTQYVVNGQVVTMTPKQAATVPGAQKLDNVKGGLDLGKTRAEIDNTKAQALERQAQAGKHSAEASWTGPKARAGIAADEALAAERYASAAGKGREGVDKERKVIRDEVDFITKQIKESGSDTFAFLGDVGSLDGLDAGQKQSVAARMDQIYRDPEANTYERQLAGRYVALMQAGGYLDSDDELAAAEGAKAEYARLVQQFGREQARAILDRRNGNAADPRNR